MTFPLTHFPHRRILQLTGEDRFAFLQGLITQDIHLLKHQTSIYTWMLSPKGRYLFDFFIYTYGDGFLLDCDNPDLLTKLNMYKLRRQVTLTPIDMHVHSAPISMSLFGVAEDVAGAPEMHTYADPRLPGEMVRIFTSSPLTHHTDLAHYHHMRIQCGLVEGALDLFPEKSFPLSCRLMEMHGLSFSKGCYVGQELVSRTHYTGVVRKKMLPIMFDGPLTTQNAESDLTQQGHVVGELHSTSTFEGKTVAMAMINVEICDLSQGFECGGVRARIMKTIAKTSEESL